MNDKKKLFTECQRVYYLEPRDNNYEIYSGTVQSIIITGKTQVIKYIINHRGNRAEKFQSELFETPEEAYADFPGDEAYKKRQLLLKTLREES